MRPGATYELTHAGWVQGALLCGAPSMTIINASIVIPNTPRLFAAFATTPGVGILVPMAIAIPILGIAVSSMVSIYIGKLISRRRMLEYSALVFAIAAILPFWLRTLEQIILARAVSGLALGAMNTAAVGLIGDYFTGPGRKRWLAIASAASQACGLIVAMVSGKLGDSSWRWPFLIMTIGWLYLLALLLLPSTKSAEGHAGDAHGEPTGSGDPDRLLWPSIIAIFCFAVSGVLIVFSALFELSVVAHEKGFQGGGQGLANGLMGLGAGAGALGVSLIPRLSNPAKMALVFGLAAVGMALIAKSHQLELVVIGAIVAGAGQGALIPLLLSWLLDRTPANLRGHAVGFFMTTIYVSWFVAPLLSRWVDTLSGNPIAGMLFYAYAATVAATLTLAFSFRRSGLNRPTISVAASARADQ